MSDKYGVGQDSYCYPGSTVLRNKLDIRDDSTLNDAEQQLSAVAAATIEFSPPPYNLASLQKIHRTLFSDLYDWAGELRTVGISKQDTRFCQPDYMEKEAGKIFKGMASANWFEGMSRSDLIVAVADAYSDLNVVHPFREGNGRTQRILFEHLVMNAGFEISWWGVENDEWLYANIAAYNCVLEPLQQVFNRCIGQQILA
ncbi:putative adenosine monophosphate-protein transferase Fic [Pseudomonas sp. CCI3.1]|uniref:putative adenosine monophosphate-protein transferase Fic n=1 Tax=Pseudomonas sp. CCI3.1 TaxID=3048618 RepID=UPI002AB372BF|nr:MULTISPECIES: putative adenosine monophosphate-protein transferase Fic [unclassified Pseudomonas]MDY7584979.1 putative adenosine monophosphate-protein transferase Fic [Pseudomonas sp. CCI3.1]MEB0066302.1 putative adenosine monophosphate-protein transferase Fic [Pseudomonas sp. CCI3.1]MEB0071620.1 putative adenosine monophosphate-protein transferase Fic [Pseudomonas sp. CCI1.4]